MQKEQCGAEWNNKCQNTRRDPYDSTLRDCRMPSLTQGACLNEKNLSHIDGLGLARKKRNVSPRMLLHSEFGRPLRESGHCVRTATLVEPRVTLPLSLKRTNIRFAAGSNGTLPLPWTKIPNVGVALALICVVAVGPMAEMHCPVAGSV